MLIATPYRDFDVRDRSPPKVISEVRKTYLNAAVPNLRPRLSADLLVKCSMDKTWYPRRVQVRNGQLQIFSSPGEKGPTSLRIPLRHLSLQAGSLPHSLSICRGQNIVLTLQTANEESFDQWVKILAIELIRQTPLDAIKYLDILTLAECWSRRGCDSYTKDWNFNNIITPKIQPCITCEKQCGAETNEITQVIEWKKNRTPIIKEENIQSTQPLAKANTEQKPASPAIVTTQSQPSSTPEEVVETLLKKCQDVETYVPVKEKLFLFESLCKMGRKVRSSEDVSLKPEVRAVTKRAKSCHDLTNLHTQRAVREICKYFEQRGDKENTKLSKNFRKI